MVTYAKWLLRLAFLPIIPLSLPLLAHGVVWEMEVVDTAGGFGYHTSLALDSLGNPCIAYGAGPAWDDLDLVYARWTGSEWSIDTVDLTGCAGFYTALVLDNDDNAHIAYRDRQNTRLMYAGWTGSGWDIKHIESGNLDIDQSSIALDSIGNPQISYYDGSTWDLKHALWSGSSWEIQVVDSGYQGHIVDDNNSIVSDTLGFAHISYNIRPNFVTDPRGLMYAYWTGSTWVTEWVDSTVSVWYNSVGLDVAGKAHIAYWDAENTALRYAHWTGSEWAITTVDNQGNVGLDVDIALDPLGDPNISYLDQSGNDRDLKYARWARTLWQIEAVDTTGRAGYGTSISLDSMGNPYISYLAYPSPQLKLARGTLVHDGIPLSIVVPSDTVLTDSIYIPQAWVRNIGDFSETFNVVITIDGYVDTSTVFSLSPSDSVQVAFGPWNVPADDSTQYIISICTFVPDDYDTTNDCLFKPVFAYSADYDAGLISIDAPGDTVFTDSLITPAATVGNFGNVPETFDVIATIDGYADTVRVTGLPPDSATQRTFKNWEVPPTDSVTYTMVVCTNAAGDIDTTNDCAQKSIFAYNPVGVEEEFRRMLQIVDFRLGQNEPNPFTRSTAICYSLPVASRVTLEVYDIAGRLVGTLVDKRQGPGVYQVQWDRKTTPSSVYFYRLKAGDYTCTKKMVVVD